MRIPLAIVLLLIGAAGLFLLISGNRLQAMRTVDMVQLIGSVICLLIAVVLLVSFTRSG